MQDNDALALATSNATTFLLYFILFALITSPATLLKNIFACWEISRSRRLSTAQNAQGRSFGVLRPELLVLFPPAIWQLHTLRFGC